MAPRSLLFFGFFLPLVAVACYVAFALLLLVPSVQRHFIFLHKIQYPFWPDFDSPERYGLAPEKARNLRLTTPDGVSIGAWHVLPDSYHRSLQPAPLSAPVALSDTDYDRALCERPTIIYLHGNAANRAAPFRIASYAQFSARMQANVVAIDYRGFGDSGGIPTEDGLVTDALAAWHWVQSKRSLCSGPALLPGEGVVFAAQSLGTGVGAKAVRALAEAGTPPQALLLVAPYRSLRKLVAEYRIGGLLPILAPALYIPYANTLLDRGMQTVFASDETLPALYAGVLERAANAVGQDRSWPHLVISHATNDEVIPYAHGENLFAEVLSVEVRRRLRVSGEISDSDRIKRHNAVQELAARLHRDGLSERLLPEELLIGADVATSVVRKWARVERFSIGGRRDDSAPSITLVRTESGGHNTVGEGIIDILREVIQLKDSRMNFA
ncbi:unnamed protein product [Parajaminaea phylloscopi]